MLRVGDRVICKRDYNPYMYKGGRYVVQHVLPFISAITIKTEDGELDMFGWSNFELDKNHTVMEIIKDL